jgi:hypothetical protein
VLPIVGTILMLTVPRTEKNKGVLLFGYYLVSYAPHSEVLHVH